MVVVFKSRGDVAAANSPIPVTPRCGRGVFNKKNKLRNGAGCELKIDQSECSGIGPCPAADCDRLMMMMKKNTTDQI